MKHRCILFALLFLLLLSTRALTAAPVVSSLTPYFGPASGGTTVSITGSGFTGAIAVSFGTTSATSFIVNSDSLITAITPIHSPETVFVTVTTPSGTSPDVPAAYYVYQGDWYAYVSNFIDQTASVIDIASNTVIATITGLPYQPRPWTISPDATRAYVSGSGAVSVIDTATNSVIATPPGFSGPTALAATPDGKSVYVVNETGSVSDLNTASNMVAANIAVGDTPFLLAITSDGAKVYVANLGDGANPSTVSVISTASNQVIAAPTVGVKPSPVAVTPDGAKVYVGNQNSNDVSVISTVNDIVIATITVGTHPNSIAITPDNTKVYVANLNSSDVYVIDTTTDTSIAITVGTDPYDIVITADGAQAYVSNQGSDNVSVIDTVSNTVIATVSVSLGPTAIAQTPDGARIYVTNQTSPGGNSVSVIDTATNILVASIAVGDSPQGIVITPDQAPLARFNANLNTAGLPSIFDASSSLSPVGVIANYFWNFGDGNTLSTSSPIASHTYAASGSYTVILTVTNSAGTSTEQVLTVSSSNSTSPPEFLRNGGPSAITTLLINILPSPPVSAPIVTGVIPNVGPTAGGIVITITGFNFTGATSVVFGSTPALFTVNSDNIITAILPPGVPGTVDVRVTTPSGTSPITPADEFTYIAPPVPLKPQPPRHLHGKQIENEFATQTDIINILIWNAPISGSTPVAYQIYRNRALTELIAVIPAAHDHLHFEEHNRKKGKKYSYFVVTVDKEGQRSTPAKVSIK